MCGVLRVVWECFRRCCGCWGCAGPGTAPGTLRAVLHAHYTFCPTGAQQQADTVYTLDRALPRRTWTCRPTPRWRSRSSGPCPTGRCTWGAAASQRISRADSEKYPAFRRMHSVRGMANRASSGPNLRGFLSLGECAAVEAAFRRFLPLRAQRSPNMNRGNKNVRRV